MKVLHVVELYRPLGGAERLLFGTLDLLDKAGHENIVVADGHQGQTRSGRWAEHFVEGLELGPLASPLSVLGVSPWIRRLRSELREIVEKHRPDVAHVRNMQNPFVVEALTEALPTVRSIHDPRLTCFTDWRLLPDRSVCTKPLGRACVTEGCLPWNPLSPTTLVGRVPLRLRHLAAHREVDVLVAESRAVKESLVLNGFSPERIALLPNMTQGRGTWEEVSAYNAARMRPGSRTVLFVGRASYEKGIDALVEAMALVRRPWKLVLVTGGEYMAKVRARVRALGIEDSVEFPGILDYEATRERYAEADVVAFPSVWMESFGLVGLEAMANGKPVVGFRTGGVPDWLADGETGLLAELGDVAGFAERLGRLLDDPALAARFGRAGLERAARDFDGGTYLRRLLGVYEQARRRRGAAAP